MGICWPEREFETEAFGQITEKLGRSVWQRFSLQLLPCYQILSKMQTRRCLLHSCTLQILWEGTISVHNSTLSVICFSLQSKGTDPLCVGWKPNGQFDCFCFHFVTLEDESSKDPYSKSKISFSDSLSFRRWKEGLPIVRFHKYGSGGIKKQKTSLQAHT